MESFTIHNKIFDHTKKHSIQSFNYNDCKMVFSSLSEFYQPVEANGFSIKYVVDGNEVYSLNQEKYIVKKGEYLLSNIVKKGFVEIESKNIVKGICLSIDKNILQQIVSSIVEPNTVEHYNELTNFFTTNNFLDNVYKDNNNAVGFQLQQLYSLTQKNEAKKINPEFFYKLGEAIVYDQIPVYKKLQNISTAKQQTKKDLYKRITIAKDFIDCNFENELTINQIATHALMSEYHFYRLFKQVQGISPLQYIIQKRLQKARQLICNQQMTVTEAAINTGFTDVFSFSKMFKKHFNITPSSLLKN